MMENDMINLLKTGVVTFVLLIGKGAYGYTFSNSSQALHYENYSVSSIEKTNTRDAITDVALYTRDDLSFCILNPNHYQLEIKNSEIIKLQKKTI